MKKHFYHQAILELCTCQHFTVDEIFERIQKEYPRAGRSTIYRNVEELAEKGELKKIAGAGNKALFERKMEQHAHFICKNTGEVFDIEIPALLLKNLPSEYQVEETDIRIFGTCK